MARHKTHQQKANEYLKKAAEELAKVPFEEAAEKLMKRSAAGMRRVSGKVERLRRLP